MDTQQKKFIRHVIELLDKVRDEHGDIPVQMLQTLLVAGVDGEMSQQELMDRTQQSKASISRNIRAWTNWTRHHKPGPAYIEAVVDPYETRRKLIRVTQRGMKFLDQLAGGDV